MAISEILSCMEPKRLDTQAPDFCNQVTNLLVGNTMEGYWYDHRFSKWHAFGHNNLIFCDETGFKKTFFDDTQYFPLAFRRKGLNGRTIGRNIPTDANFYMLKDNGNSKGLGVEYTENNQRLTLVYLVKEIRDL